MSHTPSENNNSQKQSLLETSRILKSASTNLHRLLESENQHFKNYQKEQMQLCFAELAIIRKTICELANSL